MVEPTTESIEGQTAAQALAARKRHQRAVTAARSSGVPWKDTSSSGSNLAPSPHIQWIKAAAFVTENGDTARLENLVVFRNKEEIVSKKMSELPCSSP